MNCIDELSLSIYNNLKFGVFSADISVWIYYSHFTAIFVSAILILLFFSKGKDAPVVKYLVLIFASFAALSILDVFLWTQISSSILMFLWSNWIPIFSAIFILSYYILSKMIEPDRFLNKHEILLAFIFMFISILSVTSNNLEYFDTYNCSAQENTITLATVFGLSFIILTIIILRGISFLISGRTDVNYRKTVFYTSIGLGSFLLLFASASYYASLVNFFGGDSDTFTLEQIGFFGISILALFLAFIVVKYRAFNIKLLATQALIWTLIILVGSQFFFIRNPINYVLNGITFVGAIISGILIVRSVKRVDTQREQLALANQEQETLVHFITHQIKGFFTKSRNIFDTLSDMENVPEGAQRLIGEGLRSDKEGVELVENILNAANMKTGKMKFDNKEIDLDVIIKKVLSETNDAVAAKKLKLNYYCSTAPVKFMGDEFRLRDVFKNLIQNSINYTFEGGVTIYLNKKPDQIEFIVQDTGVGLTEDDKKKLFTSGGRGAESVKFNVSSTGYGLYIVKRVIENYNGRIWAESEGRDKGSKFTLILPLV